VHVRVRAPLGLSTRDTPEARDSDVAPCTSRAVALTLQPASRWWLTSSAWGSGSFVVHKAVPRRACFPTGPTAQQAQTIVSIDLADDEVAAASLAQHLACSLDPRESVEVGALHAGLLAYSWELSQGLHTTRHRLSTLLR
jgi:hypothetical protein